MLLSGQHEPFRHRLSGVHELRQRVRPIRAAPFSAPESRGARTALACSPLTGGKFFAEPQRGIRRLRTAGVSPRPRRGRRRTHGGGQKGRTTCGFPSSLNSYLSLRGHGGNRRTATASKRSTAVGLPQRVFLRLFAVHRQRTATQVGYFRQARHTRVAQFVSAL